MSGRTILGVAGAVIGFWVGGPQGAQVGWMIGYGVGTLVDPQTLQGAQYQGRQIQGAQDGQPRAVVFGSATVVGALMDSEESPRVHRADVDSGKGGPEVENDTALLTYAIEVCDSSELRGTKVENITAVWEDEKLVYDIRPDATLPSADSAKWIANKRFYFGAEDQEPDPALSAIHGADNTPAYCGTCYMVVEDEDLVPHGERIPVYRFLVSKCTADPVGAPNFLLVTGSNSTPGAPVLAGALASGTLSFELVDDETGLDLSGGLGVYREGRWTVIAPGGVATSDDNRVTWVGGSKQWGFPNPVPERLVAGEGGSLALKISPDGAAYAADDTGSGEAVSFELTDIGGGALDVFYAGGYWWKTFWDQIYRATDKAGPYTIVSTFGTLVDIVDHDDALYAIITRGFNGHAGDTSYHSIYRSDDDGVTWGDPILSRAHAESHRPVQLCPVDDDLVAWCFGGGVWTSADDYAEWHDTGIPGAGGPTYLPDGGDNLQINGGRQIVASGGRVYTISESQCVVSSDIGLTWSDPVDLPITDALSIAASDEAPTYTGTPIPDSPGYYIDPETGELVGPDLRNETSCDTSLDVIESTLYALAGLEEGEVDVSALADIRVAGYAIQGFVSVTDAIAPLGQFYFHDSPEYDEAIHAVLRGGDAVLDIDPDDLVMGESSTDTGKRAQPVEFPRKLNLKYISPTLDYKATTQVAERWSPDVRAKGEETVDTALVATDDDAAQAASKALKVMWNEREDSRDIVVPMDYIRLVPSDPVTYDGRRYRVSSMKLVDGAIALSLAYDRKSAYSSDAVAITPTPRPPVPSGLFGPTHSAIFNAPVLRDADDKAGIYWAAAGELPNWRGAKLQLSRNGTTFEDGPQITAACTMGVLTADLPSASRYAQDWINTLSVSLHPGADDLDSVEHEQIIEGANAAAILYADGTVEIVQFETATETATRTYDLTGLMRGRKDTVAGSHSAGAQFVLLNDKVRFAAIRPDDVGQTLTFRAVSLGTDPTANASQTIAMATIESLREWQPYNIVVTPDGSGGFCVAWIVRARLGTSRTPVHSQWFDGCEVKFEVGTATYIVTTADQSVCVSAETLAAAFPSGYGTPVVTVRARSRVATNDDDFDSPPGGQTGGYDGSEAFALSGTIPGGYVGIPYDLRNGDAGITIGGGYWEARAFGEICPGVGAYGQFPLSSTYRSVGIPTTAGTYTATIYADASSPVPGHAGTGTITNSVTIAAKPTYSMIDMRSRNATRNTLVATTPPWSTFDVEAVSLYSYGFAAGKCRGEFTITNSDVALLVGVNAAYGDLAEGFRIGVQDGAPNQDAVQTTGDGTYAVEYDAATGNWEIFKAGTGSIATGNVPLPPGNQARIVCRPMSTDVVRVKANFGNETWVITPSSGYGGIPMPSVTLPCAVGEHGTDTDIMRLGSGYIGATSGTNPRVINHTFGTLGKSSGRWRIGISGATWCGLAVATYDSADGHLGASGTANSIGFNGTTLHWCFGGVHSSVTPTMPSATYRQIVFAPNFTASTVIVLVEDFDGTQTPIHTITGLPAGTWFPAESGSSRIFTFTHNPAGPDGFTDWTTTV